jgi:hypothetical protein
MENPNNVQEINKNRSTGPKTDEGKQRSSQNAIKHGLFAKFFLLPGESMEQFDALHDGFKENHKPRTATEECLVYRLAVTQWKLVRLDNLEGMAVGKATEKGDLEGKFLGNYGLYAQRLNREFQSTLKTLHAEQEPRLIEHGQEWRQAVLLRDFALRTNIPWDPADDGFVFSIELLDKQVAFNRQWNRFCKNVRIFPTTKYQDERYSKFAL